MSTLTRQAEVHELRARILTESDESKVGELQAELAAAETRAAEACREAEDSEDRERQSLEQRAELGAYLDHAAKRTTPDGAEGEYLAATGTPVESGWVPVSLLAEEEHRADAVTPLAAGAGITRERYVPRVFRPPIAGFLGAQMMTFPAGTETFSIVSTGATAAKTAAGTAKDATAGAITPVSVTPDRYVSRMQLKDVDSFRSPGFAAAIRMDMGSQLMESIDADATAVFAAAYTAAGGSNVVTLVNLKSDMAALIDGIRVLGYSDIRLVLGLDTWKKLAALVHADGADNIDALDWFRAKGIQFRVVPTGVIAAMDSTSKKQAYFVGLGAPRGPEFVIGTWSAAKVTVDPYSDAAKGLTNVTLHTYAASKVVRDAFGTERLFKLAS